MRFKRIVLTVLIFGILLCFVSNGYSSNYSGYFLQGFADGLKKGLQIGEQSKISRESKETREIKWQQRQLKATDKEESKWLEQWKIFTNSAQTLIKSKEIDPVKKRKYWFSILKLPLEIQEHKQNLIYGIIAFDKDKVEEEMKYFKNVNKAINLTDRQMNFELLDNLSSVFPKEVQLDMFSFMYESLSEEGMETIEEFFNEIIESSYSPKMVDKEDIYTETLTTEEIFGDTSLNETKEIDWESLKTKFESPTPEIPLKNTSLVDKWEYVSPGESLKYNALEDKWEYVSPGETTKYNPFENSWGYEKPNSSLKYNAFENKWEYAEPGDIFKYNPLKNSWGYE